jgi:MFS family permease
MRSATAPLLRLFSGVIILLVGNGLLGTLLGLRASIEGYSNSVTGLVMASYFAGLVIGARIMPAVFGRIGHVRVFIGLAVIVSVSVLLHGVVVSPLAWAFLRVVVGICLVGIYIVIDSGLNEQTTIANRRQVLGAYQSITLIAMGLGQYLILFGEVRSQELFIYAAALVLLSVVPVTWAKPGRPAFESRPLLSLAELRDVSQVALVGATVAGVANSAFFALGAVFAFRAGMPMQEIATFMSVVMIGGALLQLPLGIASDRFGRRRVLTYICFSAAALGLIILLLSSRWASGNWVAAFLYGGATFVVYPLSVAHANDRIVKKQLFDVDRGLLAAYGRGAVIGPVLAGLFMDRMGPAGLFVFTAVLLVLFGLFLISRRRRVPTAQNMQRKRFVPLVRTSEAALSLHPRSEVQFEKASATTTSGNNAPGADGSET